MKIRTFWDKTPSGLIEVGRLLEVLTASIFRVMSNCPETSAYLYETTGRHIPGGCHLHEQVLLTC
jgi:hypothetical protein